MPTKARSGWRMCDQAYIVLLTVPSGGWTNAVGDGNLLGWNLAEGKLLCTYLYGCWTQNSHHHVIPYVITYNSTYTLSCLFFFTIFPPLSSKRMTAAAWSKFPYFAPATLWLPAPDPPSASAVVAPASALDCAATFAPSVAKAMGIRLDV